MFNTYNHKVTRINYQGTIICISMAGFRRTGAFVKFADTGGEGGGGECRT